MTHVRIILLLLHFLILWHLLQVMKGKQNLYHVTAHFLTYFFAISVLLSKTKYYNDKFRLGLLFGMYLRAINFITSVHGFVRHLYGLLLT